MKNLPCCELRSDTHRFKTARNSDSFLLFYHHKLPPEASKFFFFLSSVCLFLHSLYASKYGWHLPLCSWFRSRHFKLCCDSAKQSFSSVYFFSPIRTFSFCSYCLRLILIIPVYRQPIPPWRSSFRLVQRFLCVACTVSLPLRRGVGLTYAHTRSLCRGAPTVVALLRRRPSKNKAAHHHSSSTHFVFPLCKM